MRGPRYRRGPAVACRFHRIRHRTLPRSDRKETAWEFSTARWRSSPDRPAASAARRPSCSREHGANVLINDLDGDVAEQTASEIDGETAVFAGDLTDPSAPDELVKTAIDAFGKIDIVVNNAGYTWTRRSTR